MPKAPDLYVEAGKTMARQFYDKQNRIVEEEGRKLMDRAILKHMMTDFRVMRLTALLGELYDELKDFGNCPFCHADLINKVEPGARREFNRIHGHPKNCLWLKLKKEVEDAASHRRDVRLRRRRR